MRYKEGTAEFDFSDIGLLETLDAVLDVATEVLVEYGEPGKTRIERLARYLVGMLGGEPYTHRNGLVAELFYLNVIDGYVSIRSVMDVHDLQLPPEFARQLAVGLLRAAEQAEK